MGDVNVSQQQAKYLMREGHLFGYLIGLWLGVLGSQWLALAWGLIVLVLWVRSIFATVPGKDS